MTKGIEALTFSPDGALLASVSRDRTVRIWTKSSEADGGWTSSAILTHTEELLATSFSADGTELVATSIKGEVLLWRKDLKTGEWREGPGVKLAGSMALTGVAFSPDATQLAVGSWLDVAVLLQRDNAKSTKWREVARLRGVGRIGRKLAFSPDGQRLATASGRGSALLWDAQTGAELAHFGDPRLDGGVGTAVAFSPDGKRLATANVDGTARLWRVFKVPQDLVDHIKRVTPRCLTRAERLKHFLQPEPERWCVTGPGLEAAKDVGKWKPKWPYRSIKWRKWLVAKDRGEEPPLPDMSDTSKTQLNTR